MKQIHFERTCDHKKQSGRSLVISQQCKTIMANETLVSIPMADTRYLLSVQTCYTLLSLPHFPKALPAQNNSPDKTHVFFAFSHTSLYLAAMKTYLLLQFTSDQLSLYFYLLQTVCPLQALSVKVYQTYVKQRLQQLMQKCTW